MPEVPATHPGERLGEILDDLNISVPAFAERVVSDSRYHGHSNHRRR